MSDHRPSPVASYRPARTLAQLAKFAAVGACNTGIDFGVLNLLSWLTGIYGGSRLAPINLPGFALSLINSYVLNKYWTFKGNAREVSGRELGTFTLTSLIGLAINTAVVVGMTSLLTAPLPLDPQLWENLAKVVATGVSLTWNFVGYKYLVFAPSDWW